ncbi:T9SS type A sorting domain-containing protein [Pseudopedobacter beijingensis]|uniref:T9SS type A sorting domain-containing protein n=1 Tax=Pseudopedobacter beijingensis TaxID=1207056 RepID=A0ABW4ICU0_9SPHI
MIYFCRSKQYLFIFLYAIALLCSLPLTTRAQNYYHNGPLSTGSLTANGSNTAPTGYTWSELQSVNGITNTNLGFGAIYDNSGTTNMKITDDFTITAGKQLQISRVDFYCHQSSYTGTTPPVDVLRIEIWDGDPSLSTSTKIAGDMTTNRYNASNSANAMMYRIGYNSPGNTRKIWRISGDISTTLTAGTYWIVFQVHASNGGSIFFPTVTKPGVISITGSNAQQHSGTEWAGIVDAGSNTPVTIPFTINYHNYSATLPVSFADFQATRQDDAAKLTWQTHNEKENKEFIISRSVNAIDFTEITRKQGAGTSQNTKQYTYTDFNPIIGTSYYKLEQVDFNGNRVELKTIPFEFSLNEKIEITTYPNPGKEINLLINNLPSSDLQVSISTITGVMVHQENIKVTDTINKYALQLKNQLPQGIYIITIKDNNGKTYTVKHIIETV